jgi:hypothetical protein
LIPKTVSDFFVFFHFFKDQIIQQIKPGANGIVFLVKHTSSGEMRILKVCFVEEQEKKDFEEQINHWKKLCVMDDHIVIYKENFYDGLNACLYTSSFSFFNYIIMLHVLCFS